MDEEKNTIRDSFVFYRSFYDAIQNMDELKNELGLSQEKINEYKISILDAICEFGLNGKEIDLNGVSNILFTSIKPQLEANTKRYKSGLKGGRPKKTNNQEITKLKPKTNQNKTKEKPNVNVNDNVNDNVNVNENISAWFETFWREYPRKVNKKKSKEKFMKICKDEETYNQIMRGLRNQKNTYDWKKNNGQFVPHPTTWLNGERWKDEIETAIDDDEKREEYDPIDTGQDDICF